MTNRKDAPGNDFDRLADSADRASRWAATMQGYAAEGSDQLVTAHEDTTVTVKCPIAWDRARREADENDWLCDGATHSSSAGHRAKEERPDALRTCFERDRDRIVHSSAFRRLAGKTQVFIFPADHQRTRLTHALEVAQIATAIAKALHLNVALVEAIALGHDCGHGPGGHPSEDVFSMYVPGGFDHAPFGADVMLRSLNLCEETLDGIRNHSWSRPAAMTAEGEVVSWADRIAYVCHDFEDAKASGILDERDLPDVVRERCGETHARQIASLIDAMVDATSKSGTVGMFSHYAEALGAFRAMNYERIYFRPDSIEQARRTRSLLEALVEAIANDPKLLVDPLSQSLVAGSPEAFVEAVTYVAGMTDRFAIDTAIRLLDWPESELPRAVTASS